MVVRCVLKDIKQVVASGDIMEYEVLKDFGKNLDTRNVQNWTKNYDIVLCRCEEIVLLRINVVKVPDCGVQGITGTGVRGCPMTLFILLHGSSRGISEGRWSSSMMRVQVAMKDD